MKLHHDDDRHSACVTKFVRTAAMTNADNVIANAIELAKEREKKEKEKEKEKEKGCRPNTLSNTTSNTASSTATKDSAPSRPPATPEVISLIDSDDEGGDIGRRRKRHKRPPPVDTEVVVVAHVHESPRSKRRRPVIDLAASGSDSDCIILGASFTASKLPEKPNAQSSPTEAAVAEDGEGGDVAVVTATKGLRANVDYPHLRSNCGMYKKRKLAVERLLHCDNCFCFVCDTAVSSCEDWVFHAFAEEGVTCWTQIRRYARRKREGKNDPVPKKAIEEANAARAVFLDASEPESGSSD